MTRFNKVVANRVLIHLAGHSSFVELEHVGRRSGRTYRIPVNAFRDGDRLTIGLTYGSRVDWYRNVVAAGGCRIRMGREWLDMGAPRLLSQEVGLERMPRPARPILRALRVTDFLELSVISAHSIRS